MFDEGQPLKRFSAGFQFHLEPLKEMEPGGQFSEIIANYRRHNWALRRVLLRPATRAEMGDASAVIFEDAPVEESEIDALWFARPSQAGREAWELRLVAETPYALFETFEPDEPEEEREELRREMEARLREYSNRA
ncbi:MAG TPA: hypothetical protein VF543_20275 [Pyrinomonadaceae bacterium]|jgi:hypothetical protein